ncbi:DNA-directed RNA polymerase subunit alpha C-terminal domain-containing protein [Caballeronia sp. TF1N1]|uniref:DNA-directed RNA polymerase subunit alpha C-terminal domain-containing protein n=1 Tax=Caballeronia sp. TF1N1 TaxID=2878153 RepID=UPI001FD0A7D3|nr:DNA-directed RNA polymerase subunit alpha C-terminal domain-containing protein [Caballeronia sp. TF1N1]
MQPPFKLDCTSDVSGHGVDAVSSSATSCVHATRSLRALGLKPRTLHSLRRAGVRSVRGLCELSEHELLLIPGIGHGSIVAITAALGSCSLSLDQDGNEHI